MGSATVAVNDLIAESPIFRGYHKVYGAPTVLRAQELCENRGGRPGLPFPNKPTVSVDVKQQLNHRALRDIWT